jgi:hypothetical protein
MSKREASPKPKKAADVEKKAAAAFAVPVAATTDPASSVTVTDEDVKVALSTGGWKATKQESTGKTYYVHKTSKVTTWDLKKTLAKEKAERLASAAASPKQDAEPLAAAAQEKPAAAAAAVAATAAESSAASSKGTSEPAATDAAKAADANSSSAGAASVSADAPQPTPAAQQQELVQTALKDYAKYTDPLQRLVNDNTMLQHLLASGNRGEVALDFQAKYDAVQRTNQALTVQMGRMKTEYDAMQRALTDANVRIHQLQLQVQEQQQPTGRTKDQELQLTMHHLREQNRVLVQQVSELSIFLSRGLNEAAFRIAGVQLQQQQQEANLSQGQIISRFLESAGRQVLCSTCVTSVNKARDSFLQASETTVGSPPPPVPDRSHVAPLTSVADQHPAMLSPGGSGFLGSASRPAALQPNHFQPQQPQSVFGGISQQLPPPQQQQGASQNALAQQYSGSVASPSAGSRAIGAAPVMYGGFVVRNNRGPA